MFRSFFGNRSYFRAAYGSGGLLLVLLFLQVQTAVVFAEKMRVFGNLIQNPEATRDDYFNLMFALAIVHFLFFVYETLINYISRRFVWYWREAITLYYIGRWNPAAADLEGSSQRLTDAINNFTQLAITLVMPVARSILVAFAFFPMLWTISADFRWDFLGFQIPGVLLWAALFFGTFGTLVSVWIGGILTKREWQIQKEEAEFRSEIEEAQLDDHRGQQRDEEMQIARRLFMDSLNQSYWRLHRSLLNFDIWFGIYKQAWGFLPMFFLGLVVISGAASYGAMMQAMSALNEASSSMSVFSSLMTTYTKYRSYALRLEELEATFDGSAAVPALLTDPATERVGT